MCKAEAFPFREPKTVVEEQDLGDKAIPTFTKYKNKWALTIFLTNSNLREGSIALLDSGGMFTDYDLRNVGVLSTGIKDMEALSLNYWLRKFVMKVAKKSEESGFPLSILQCIVCGI